MSSLVAHAIVGSAIAKAAHLDNRGTAVAIALSVLPDADVIAGFAVKRDGEAWHHATWSHSLRTALAVGCLAGAGWLFPQAGRNGTPLYREALSSGGLATAIVGSHLLLDKWLRNPLEKRKLVRFRNVHDPPGVLRYHVVSLPSDFLFYGSLSLAFYRAWRWLFPR